MKIFYGMLSAAAMLCLVAMPVAQADEPIPIRVLLDSATAHNTHTVTIGGIIRDMKAFPPFVTKLCSAVYGSYVLTLEDDSGSISVEVFGVCGASGGSIQVSNGPRVLVIGQFLLRSSRSENVPIIYTNASLVTQVSN